jgi:putative DNA primase/helicase
MGADALSDMTKGRSEWTPLVPAPVDVPKPPGRHMKRQEPVKMFTYRDQANQLIGYVGKFKRKDHEGFEWIPLTFCQHGPSGDRAWRWISFPEPRPLYRLDLAQADVPVLICTDEEQADRAGVLLAGLFWCVSWPGGERTYKKADWSPLAGREVFIFPDGTTTPSALAQFLLQIEGKDQVGELSIALPKKDVPAGWTVADAIEAGWPTTELTTFALPPASPPRPPAPPAPKKAGPPGSDDWRIGLLYADSGKLIDCRENVIMILQRHPAWRGVIGLDEFTNRVMIKEAPEDIDGFAPGEWQPQNDVQLGLWLAQQDDRMLRVIVKSEQTIGAGVNFVAAHNRFNPVRNYLEEQEWDEQDRVDFWLSDHLGVKKNTYSQLVGRYFLLGMVARIYEPGCQMRLVPILEGQQWKGKSTALRTLGGEWFSDTPFDVGDKDAYQAIQGKWLYEIAEYDSFSKAEARRVKAFISSVKDNFRAPYERRNRDWPRQGVFSATVNEGEYFKDPTGNTRFAPVLTTDITIDSLAASRDQLFAEAVFRYKNGERQYPTREELETHFMPEQEDRMVDDPWTDIILRYLESGTFKTCTTEDVLTEALKVEISKIDNARSMSTRVGTAMKKAGWEKGRETSGARGRFYTRPAIRVPVVVQTEPRPKDKGDPEDVPF